MGITPQTSLFEPSVAEPMEASVSWINDALFGEVALSLCVLAVVFLGGMMLTGRLPLRNGVRILVGCFALLGAPVVGAGLLNVAKSTAKSSQPSPSALPTEPKRDLSPADYDPYSGA
ncbi:MAG: TrbC/VirB2 family protein [Erythrobacter sp.]